MMKSLMNVVTLASCLTFCQLGLAQAEGQLKSKSPTKEKKNSSKIVDMAMAQLADSGDLRLSIGYQYSTIKSSGSFISTSQTDSSTGTISTNTTGANLPIAIVYGLGQNFNIGGGFSYANTKSTSEVTSNFGSSQTENTTKGLSDPRLEFLFHSNGDINYIAGFSTLISTGPTKTTSENNKYESDNLRGGSSLTPKLGITADLKSVKIAGKLSYEINGERKSIGSSGNTTTTTGGNTAQAMAAVELPKLANLGSFFIVSKSESSNTDSSSTFNQSSTPTIGVAGLSLNANLSKSVSFTPVIANVFYIEKPTSNNYQQDISDSWIATMAMSFKF